MRLKIPAWQLQRHEPNYGVTGDAPHNELPPPVLAGGVPLIFDWRPVRWRKTRLMMALAIAGAGHLLVFYLFQVVTESSPRQAPPIREAVILSSAGESTRRLLESVEDRFTSLSQPAPLGDSGAAALAGLVKGYVPTWQDHRPALKLLPAQAGAGPLPSLMTGAAGVLPPLPAGDATTSASAGPLPAGPLTRPRPVIAFQSGLTGRALLAPVEWSAVVTAADWPEEGPASFLLRVEPAGNVSFCLSLGTSTGLAGEEVEVLREALLKLRFAEKMSADVEWGWVDVLW